jgi:oligopeptide/dipeptide ABC transporter ATP-binding protein
MRIETLFSKTPLLKAENITKYFYSVPSFLEKTVGRAKTRVTKAVDGVDLEIMPHETLGLVGESGCGKSTLGRVLVGLYRPSSGSVSFCGNSDLNALSKDPRIQMVFQNPYSSLNPRHTVRDILSIALEKRGVPLEEREHEAILLLNRVGLKAQHLDHYPRQFSGGQRQRIGIARALALQPSFIVADEPVSSLDVSVQAQILNLLEELQKELGLTYLLIAHDLAVVHHASKRIAVMYLGKIVEIGSTEEIFHDPRHPYTQALLSSIPRLDDPRIDKRFVLEGTVPTAVDPPPGCKFQSRCPYVDEICKRECPEKTSLGKTHFVWCHAVD